MDGPDPDWPLLPVRSGRGYQLCPCLACGPRHTTASCICFTARVSIWTSSPPAGCVCVWCCLSPFCAGSRLVCLADGIKAPKEGKRMPAVKMLAPAIGQQLQTGIHHGPFVSGHFAAGSRRFRTCGRRTTDLAHSRRTDLLQPRFQNPARQVGGPAVLHRQRLGSQGSARGRCLLCQRQAHRISYSPTGISL